MKQVSFVFPQSRMKYEKVHSIYNRLLAIEDIDPTLVWFSIIQAFHRSINVGLGAILVAASDLSRLIIHWLFQLV